MIRFLFVAVSCLMFSLKPVHAQQYSNLIHNRSLNQWMLTNGGAVEKGWQVEPDGTLHLSGKGENIVTREEYGDFDLWFEFRIADKGNSGIKYRVRQFDSRWLGLEYQVQDDAAFPNLATKHYTASLYDIIDRSSPLLERKYAAAGEFNVARVIVQKHRIRHWMNGNLIIDELDCSLAFLNGIANSKFKDTAGFGRNFCGRLMLTDHGSEVWYRNLYVRRLDGCPPVQ